MLLDPSPLSQTVTPSRTPSPTLERDVLYGRPHECPRGNLKLVALLLCSPILINSDNCTLFCSVASHLNGIVNSKFTQGLVMEGSHMDVSYARDHLPVVKSAKQHKRRHTEEKPKTCQVCRRSFRNCSNLHKHMKTHTGDKPYKCKVCDKSFTQGSHLKDHLRVHTGDKPYKCLVCQIPFAHKSNLTVHMRKHTGDRPYTCKLCQKSFIQGCHLKDHMKVQ